MIELHRHPLVSIYQDSLVLWLFKVEATSSTEAIPSAIFVHHAAMGDDRYEGDVFEAVASVNQIGELPEDSALDSIEGKAIPYYRSNTLVCLLNNPKEAEDLWVDIQEDVDELYQQLVGVNEFFI